MSSLFSWCSRRAGGLAMLALLFLCYQAISREAAAQRYAHQYLHPESLDTPKYAVSNESGRDYWTRAFAYYSLAIHCLVSLFPLRAIYALWDLTRSLKKTRRSKALCDDKLPRHRRSSSPSLESSGASNSSPIPSTFCSDPEDLDSGLTTDTEVEPDGVIHAIIIPNYKEEVDTLRETLEVLASHPQARDSYDVYLGMEQRESDSELKAMSLVQEFVRGFRSIHFTLHPSGIPGESAGKGSNVAWAARRVSERYAVEIRKNVVITGIDADSHLSSNYFALVTAMHLEFPETAVTTLYSAPIIFDRNADKVPALVRVADILWSAAGMSGLYRGSTVAPPTSVYSLPLQLVDRVGGWDCDGESIGEDLHMYLKCFFALNGNLTVRTVLSPVSQSNVTGGAGTGIKGAYADIRARYKQAMRHMWGALDTGFALRRAVELWRERKHTTRAFRPLHVAAPNGATGPFVPYDRLGTLESEQPVEDDIFTDVTQDTLSGPDYVRIFYLFHRLFEAHILPVHMAILVISSALLAWVASGGGDHGLDGIFYGCNVLRTLGFLEVACYLFMYERFHRICVASREKEMSEAGLARGMNFSHRSVCKNLIDYIMVPLVAPLYGAIPCAQAQLCHFWTLDLVYTVSKKATRQRQKSASEKVLA